MSHAEVRKIFFGLMLAAFLAALNQTIIATALPTIGRHFGDFENLSWIVTAYLLTSTAVAPLYGKLSDIWGRRAMILAAIGLFIAGSAVAAAAPDMTMLILGRGLQGIGGGGILPLCQSVIADVVAPRERGRYQAYMGVVWVTSGVAGPVFGGMLAEHFHWSLIFWVNVPLGLGAALLTHVYLKRIPRHDRRHKLDVLGAVPDDGLVHSAAAGADLGRHALRAGLRRRSSMLIGASFVLSLLFGWRLTRAAEPFLPLTVLNNPVMRMGTASASLAMGVQIGLTIFVPMYFEVAFHLSATESGIALIPIALTTPGSLLSGQAMMYWKHYKRAPVIGLACALVALVFLIWRPDMPLAYVIVLLCGGRHRGRPGLSGDHGVDPERGAASSGRHRHGRAELLPLAGRGLHRGGAGRDPAGGARRCAGAGRPRHLGDYVGERGRQRRRLGVPLGVPRGLRVPGAESALPDPDGGAPTARQRNAGRSAGRAAARPVTAAIAGAPGLRVRSERACLLVHTSFI